MRIWGFGSRALSSCVVAAMLAGCGSQPPIGAPGAMPQSNPMASFSAKGQNLLYVADLNGIVKIVSYPAGEKMGSIYYGPYSNLSGECTDRSGNVWITDYDIIKEYAHGGTKPIADKSFKWYLKGCSADPKTNDVAAVGQSGTVFIWSSTGGKVKTYHTKAFYTLRYCGYDADGNLFVDGFEPNNNDKFLFFELPSGGTKFTQVSLDRKVRGAGQVQWDGRYVAIQNSDPPYAIYQVKVSGDTGTVVNTIGLDGLRAPVGPSWIAGSTVFVPYSVRGKFGDAIGVFGYPAGGKPVSVLQGKPYRYVNAVTLSR